MLDQGARGPARRSPRLLPAAEPARAAGRGAPPCPPPREPRGERQETERRKAGRSRYPHARCRPCFPGQAPPFPPPPPPRGWRRGRPGRRWPGRGGAGRPARPTRLIARGAPPRRQHRPPARPEVSGVWPGPPAGRPPPPPAAGDGGAGGGFFGLLLLPVVVFSRVKSGAGGAAAAKAGGPLAQRRERGAAGPGSPSRGGGTGRVCLRGGASCSALAASVPVRLVHSGCWGWFACFICLGFLTPIYALFFFFPTWELGLCRCYTQNCLLGKSRERHRTLNKSFLLLGRERSNSTDRLEGCFKTSYGVLLESPLLWHERFALKSAPLSIKTGENNPYCVFFSNVGCVCVSLVARVEKALSLIFGSVPLNLAFREGMI